MGGFLSNPLVAGAVLTGLWMVGVTTLSSTLLLYGLQAVALGALAVEMGLHHHEPALAVVGCAIVLLKGVAAPLYLAYVVRRIGCRWDEGLILAPPLLLLLTVAALAGLFLMRPFDAELSTNALPALALLMLGMIVMVSRRMAISQIVGFLVLENGIFLFTILQSHAMPLVVELGVLLDVLVGTMLAGLLVFRIRASLEHIDVTELRQLRG